jgi:DNA ligase-1
MIVFDILDSLVAMDLPSRQRALGSLDEKTLDFIKMGIDGVKIDVTINHATDIKATGRGTTLDEFFMAMNIARNTSVNRQRCKETIIRAIEHLPYPAQEWCIKCVNKHMGLGIGVKVFNKFRNPEYPEISTFGVPLAKQFDFKHISNPVIWQPKYDGLRSIYSHGHFYTRNGHILAGLDYIAQKLQFCEGNGLLDGELIVPGTQFDKISGQLRSGTAKDAVYMVFDYLRGPEDEELPYHLRYANIPVRYPNLVPSHLIPVTKEEEIYNIFNQVKGQNLEGVMLKDPNAPFVRARTYNMMKVKSVETTDLIVINLEEGTGKNEDKVGALICQGDVHVGTGLSDQQREDWWRHPIEIVGKTVEIAYMERSSKGKLRHPRLLRVRWDK